MLTVASRLLRTSAALHLERGGEFKMRGSAWERDFLVTDVDGQTVLTAAPRTSTLSFHQHDYGVSKTRAVFQLPEIVALVQIWRMVRRNESSDAGATVTG